MTHLMKFNHIKLNHSSYHNFFLFFYHSLPFSLYQSLPFPIYYPSLPPLSLYFPFSSSLFFFFLFLFSHRPFLPFYYPIPLPLLLPLAFSSFPSIILFLFIRQLFLFLFTHPPLFLSLSFNLKSQSNFYLNEKVEKFLINYIRGKINAYTRVVIYSSTRLTLTRIHYSRLSAEISQEQNDQIRIMDDLRYGQLYLWVLRLTWSVIKSRDIRARAVDLTRKYPLKILPR